MLEAKHSSNIYLLDTNYCSRIIYGDQAVISKLYSLKDLSIVTCVIVSGELFFMAYKSKYKEENLQQVQNFLNDIEIYPIDVAVSHLYGKIKADILEHFGPKESMKRKRIKIEDIGFTENDIWIAAIAKHYGLVVVSSDSDFDRMKDIINLKVKSLNM